MPQCSIVVHRAQFVVPRWLWFLPLMALTTALAIWGFRMGYVSAHLTETDAINHYAKRYVQEHAGTGAAFSDCVAYPGTQPQVWLIVDCGGAQQDGSPRYIYHVNRYGGLVFETQRHVDDARPQPLKPET